MKKGERVEGIGLSGKQDSKKGKENLILKEEVFIMLKNVLVLLVLVFFVSGCTKEAGVQIPAAGVPGVTEAGVRFVYSGPASSVFVSGEFNNWSQTANPAKNVGENNWVATINLSPGKHLYKFIVDGNWTHDENNPNTEPDGFGGINSVINVAAETIAVDTIRVAAAPREVNGNMLFTFGGAADSVFISGEFNNWNENSHPLRKNEAGIFSIEINISPGKYLYKFIVDGNWIADPSNPNTAPDGFGGENSVVNVN